MIKFHIVGQSPTCFMLELSGAVAPRFPTHVAWKAVKALKDEKTRR